MRGRPKPDQPPVANPPPLPSKQVDQLVYLSWQDRIRQWLVPVRFHSSETARAYSSEQAMALARRLPVWFLAVVLLSWEETSPYTLISIRGPSMLPTMAADGTDVWLRSTWVWFRRLGLSVPYRKGDLVGLAPPSAPEQVSCKRVIGVEGDGVQRYGEYVHLYVDQDPQRWGIVWPDESDERHTWMDRSCAWDTDAKRDAQRTLVVPPGHVWVEGDCPALAIDSRHYGPVPVEWLRGKLVARLWPLWKGSNEPPRTTRPHPMPLDSDTLLDHNVHRLPAQNS